MSTAQLRRGPWRRILATARTEADAAGHGRVGSEHLLLAIVVDAEGRVGPWLRTRDVVPDDLRRHVRGAIDRRGGDPDGIDPVELAGLRLDGEVPPLTGSIARARGRRSDRELTAEAVAALETASERARHQGRRGLIADDVAVGLARTRGCRARDLLVDLGVPLGTFEDVATGG